MLRRAKREGREPEPRLARIDLAERHEVLPREAAALDQPAERSLHELAVAAVERVGDGPVGISLDMGVEQEQRSPPDTHAPDAQPYRYEAAVVVRELDHGSHRHELERQSARIGQRVMLDLPVVRVEPLLEVAAAVEEADADERDAELRRGLEIVAGENAEPPGVDGKALVEPE